MNIQDFNPKNRSKMVDNLMENKMIREFNEIIDETNKTFPLFESVLDPIQKYRCPTLFGENNKEESPKMKKEAREFLLNIAEKFVKDIEIPGAKITEFFMIGSSLGYQYRADADIDCDLRINVKKEDMWGKFSLIPKGIIYPGSSQPVNIFLLCEDDAPYDFENHCENAYDLLENKWIKQGMLRNEYPIPYSYVAGVSEFIMDGIALQLQRADRHIQDVHKYISLDPERVEISAKERTDAIADAINDLKIDADALNLSHHFLFRFDGEGFSGEEFRISIDYKASRKHYTINNLIYKYVDGFGYYDKVNAKIKEIWAVIEKAENELEKNKGSANEERDQERVQKEVKNINENINNTEYREKIEDYERKKANEQAKNYKLLAAARAAKKSDAEIFKLYKLTYHPTLTQKDIDLYFDRINPISLKSEVLKYYDHNELLPDRLNQINNIKIVGKAKYGDGTILSDEHECLLFDNGKYFSLNDNDIYQFLSGGRAWGWYASRGETPPFKTLKEAESVESVNDKTTVLNNLRSDIQDEYTAVKGYDAHADFAEKNGCSDIAKILRDIRDEEKVHIGELEAVMKKYDKEFKTSLADGGKEAEEVLKEDREYTNYVKGHIKNTKNGYRWLKKYLPEIFPKGFFENRKIKQAIKRHDKSKWGKEEYKTYSDFQKIRKMKLSDEEYDAKKGEFNKAWNHHQKTNKHHWQYWVLIQADGSHKVLDMPFENIIEMICDWWTFSWKDNDLMSIFTWYENNKNKMILSQNTRQKVEMILGKMKNKIKEQQQNGMLKECDEFSRVLEIEEIILTENKWSADNFETPEEIGKELARLHAAKEEHLKADDMPSLYFENIDVHIKALNDKMKEFDCKCEKLKESPMFLDPLPQSKDRTSIEATNMDGSEITKDQFEELKKTGGMFKANEKTHVIQPNGKAAPVHAKDGNKKYNPVFVKESRLPEDGSDPEYGIPEQKKYPLYDKAHVEAAIKLFGHVDAQYEQQLARAILVKMKKYGIPYTSVGEDNKLFKWIPKKYLE